MYFFKVTLIRWYIIREVVLQKKNINVQGKIFQRCFFVYIRYVEIERNIYEKDTNNKEKKREKNRFMWRFIKRFMIEWTKTIFFLKTQWYMSDCVWDSQHEPTTNWPHGLANNSTGGQIIQGIPTPQT